MSSAQHKAAVAAGSLTNRDCVLGTIHAARPVTRTRSLRDFDRLPHNGILGSVYAAEELHGSYVESLTEEHAAVNFRNGEDE